MEKPKIKQLHDADVVAATKVDATAVPKELDKVYVENLPHYKTCDPS